MIYNLLKKEAASNWGEAKLKLIKSTSLDKNRIKDDYAKAFPYDYDVKVHFVYEGNLNQPHKIDDDFSIYFYSERECVELGYRTLGIGETLQGADVVYTPAPDSFHTWNGSEWIYEVELERISIDNEIQATEKELEATQAQITSRKSLGMFTETLEDKTVELLAKHSDLCYELSTTY